jgi:peptidyl-prolyl cis-trans isomerase SurA
MCRSDRRRAWRKWLFIAALGVLGALRPMPATAQNELKIAAVVNEDVITELDVYARLRMAIVSARLEDNPEVRQRLVPQVLRSLIDDRLKIQEAAKLDIEVEQVDIDRRIERIAEKNDMSRDQFDAFLAENGILLDAVSKQIEADLKWSRIVQRKIRPRIVISDSEITDELARMKEASGSKEYRLYQIFLAVDGPDQEQSVRESAMRLLEQLQSGVEFSSLAAEFSQDEGAFKGGDWGWMRPDQMDSEVAGGIQATPLGDVVGPVRGTGGYYIAIARDSRLAGSGESSSGIVKLQQVLWALPLNAAESEINRATSEANTLATQIQSCADLPAAADKSGGVHRDLGSVLVTDLPQDVQTAALNLPIGVPSEPIRTDRGVGLYIVCDRQQGDQAALSRTAIADRLGRQRLETLARGYLSDLRRNAVIDVRIGQ